MGRKKKKVLNPLFFYNENTLLTHGKYKYTTIKNIPRDYLLKVYSTNNGNDPYLLDYITKNLDKIKNEQPVEEVFEILTCEKIAYIDEKAAGLALGVINRKEQEEKKPVRFYKCDKCPYYHLTSKQFKY